MAFIAKVAMAVSTAHNTFRDFHFVQQFPCGTHHNMKLYSWKIRASCEQPTSGLHFQFEFHITVLRYMGRVSVKQFATNCNIKNMRFFLCTVYFILKILNNVLLVGCLTSQQHASVSQGRICTDNFTCCHTEIEAADQTFHLTQSQYTDTGPTSPSADPITPGAWQGSHWSANV